MTKRTQPTNTPTIRVAIVASVDTTFRALLRAQIDALIDAGYDVRCLATPGDAHRWLKSHGYRMVNVHIPRQISPLKDLLAFWKLYRYFRSERITVVHTHTPKPGLIGQWAARLAGVPIVINTVHGFYFHEYMPRLTRRFYILTESLAARCSTLILSQNAEDIDTAIRLGIAPPERLRLLGNGIDLSLFDPDRFTSADRENTRATLNIPADALVVAIIARLVRDKGILELLEAMQRIMLRRNNVHLLVIGPSDPAKSDCIDLGRSILSECEGRVHCLGHRDDVPALLAASDIYALPSWREGFPRSAMEAAAMRLPIVATNIRGCRQVVDHDRSGFLVALRDPTALEHALDILIASDETRHRMGRAGREKALHEFDEKHVVSVILDTYTAFLHSMGRVDNYNAASQSV